MGAVYEMTVSETYYLRTFWRRVAFTDTDLIAFITQNLTKGLGYIWVHAPG